MVAAVQTAQLNVNMNVIDSRSQSHSHSQSLAPTVARKRRRQILQTLRETKANASASIKSPTSVNMTITMPSESEPDLSSDSEPDCKKQCIGSGIINSASSAQAPKKFTASSIATITATATSIAHAHDTATSTTAVTVTAPRKVSVSVSHCEGIVPPVNLSSIEAAESNPDIKRPQMRYEPDEPMTKEDATIWRREQRRKRNRESAAASRQRQRDRIMELEGEVDDWRVKYDAALSRLQRLEEVMMGGRGASSAITPTAVTSSCSSSLTITAPHSSSSPSLRDNSVAVSPCSTPPHSPVIVTPAAQVKVLYGTHTLLPKTLPPHLPLPLEVNSNSGTVSVTSTKTTTNANTKTQNLGPQMEVKKEHLKETHSLPA